MVQYEKYPLNTVEKLSLGVFVLVNLLVSDALPQYFQEFRQVLQKISVLFQIFDRSFNNAAYENVGKYLGKLLKCIP